jgi:hypothetical protein
MINIYSSGNDIIAARSYSDDYYSLIIRSMTCRKKLLFVSRLNYVLFIRNFNDLQIKGKVNHRIVSVLLAGLIL